MQLKPDESRDDVEEHFTDQSIKRIGAPLIGSLRGIRDQVQQAPVNGLIISINYKTSPPGALQPFNERQQLSASLDYKAVRELLDYSGIGDEKIVTVTNETATADNIIDAFEILADSSAVFIQGHGERGPSDTEYMTYDFHMSNPPRGIACSDLCASLSLSNNGNPTQRFLLTDFCFSDNFNNLRYVLEINDTPRWVQSPDWNPAANLYDVDTLVHFAAGSPDQRAHEFSFTGGFFSQGFCKSMREPRTLATLLETVRNHVEESMHLHKLDESLQVPQIYSSHPLDLNDANIMKMFGFFKA